MSRFVKCDTCGSESAPVFRAMGGLGCPDGWLDLWLRTGGDDDEDGENLWTFCGWSCAAQFTTSRALDAELEA